MSHVEWSSFRMGIDIGPMTVEEDVPHLHMAGYIPHYTLDEVDPDTEERTQVASGCPADLVGRMHTDDGVYYILVEDGLDVFSIM